MSDGNGEYKECPYGNSEALVQIEETHAMISQLQPHIAHLGKLDTIDTTLGEIKDALLTAATGNDRVPVPVVNQIVKCLAVVIFGLLAVIVFLLTGSHLGWIGQLH